MSGQIPIHFTGNLTSEVELRFTASGAAVASFTVAVTERIHDKATGEWKDGSTSFMRCQVWRQYAENAAESLVKGTRVVVIGSLRQREYETSQGEKRSVFEVEVDEVGPALRYATAKTQKVGRSGAPAGGADPWASSAPAGADPWATPAGQASFDEPPF